MRNPKKQLFLDINEIELTASGVRDFYWPINPYEVSKIYRVMTKNVISVLREATEEKLPGIDAGIILSFYFAQEAASVYQACLLKYRAVSDHYVIEPSKRNRLMKAFLKDEIPAASGIVRQLRNGPPDLKRWRAPLRFVRDILVGFQEGMSRRSLFPVDYEKQTISVTIDHLAILNARRTKEKIFYKRPNTWFKKPNLNNIISNKNNNFLIGRLVSGIESAFLSGNKEFPEYIKLYLKEWLVEAVTLVEWYYEGLRNQEGTTPTRLWANTAGNVWGRILARYLQNYGGHVTRYDHGCGCGYFSTSRAQGVFDFEDCDQFVTFSKNQAIAFKESFTGNDIFQKHAPVISTINSEKHFKRHLNNPRLDRRPNGNKTVMYVASVYPSEHVYQGAQGFMSDVILLDWETRLIQKLQNWKYNVLLKPHPAEDICIGPPLSIKNLFGSIVIDEPFEKVFHKADIIIFDDPTSTLFSTLLLSDKTFIYLDFDVETFSDEARCLLEKRCPIIKGYYDDDNRACVDWGSLHATIESREYYSDQSFSEKYLLS